MEKKTWRDLFDQADKQQTDYVHSNGDLVKKKYLRHFNLV